MSGNGVDLGTIAAMLQTVIQSQAEMRAEFGSRLSKLESEIAAVMREMKDTRDELKGVRQEVGLYHSSVMGHGMLISEMDERLTRVEQRPDRPKAA